MAIFNYTPHSINVVEACLYDPEIRKFTVSMGNLYISQSIPSLGMLNAKIDTVPGEPIDGIPTFIKKVVGCDPLPDKVGPNDIVVVSALYATAYRMTYGDDDRLYTVADPVYDAEDPRKILGSRGICPAF